MSTEFLDIIGFLLLVLSGGMHVYGKQQLTKNYEPSLAAEAHVLVMRIYAVAWILIVPIVIVVLISIHGSNY